MIQSAVTISLVPEAKGGPFIFWDDLPGSLAQAARLGFQGVEIFAPSADALDARLLRQLLTNHGLKLAAMGTGAGWVLRKLHLSGPDLTARARALDFIGAIVDFAGSFGAPAIIGSMQGRFENSVTREQALEWLREALEQLGPRAHACRVPLLFEPINRYETNLINSVTEGLQLLQSLKTKNIKLLCDLFHMNIEEKSIPAALRLAGKSVGHVHFVDSNRRPAGHGHIDFDSVALALRESEYSGYVSGEALAYPNSEDAAKTTMVAFKKHFVQL
jgi:sugar phosphate isomerase/epimerase